MIVKRMSVSPLVVVVIFLLVVVHYGASVQPLGKYNVDQTKISASGFSSGADMATQLHVSYSSVIMGVGMVAGNPYYCAKGNSALATGTCMKSPQSIVINDLTKETDFYESSGYIDFTVNMNSSKVFIFGGSLDTVVVQGVGMKIQQYYLSYVNESNVNANNTLSYINTVFNQPAAHTFPTVHYGNACSSSTSPYLGSCNYYAAYELLNHIYSSTLQRPPNGTATPGSFYEFEQQDFFDVAPSEFSMDTIGYAYVPSGCISGFNACKLHVVLHGCSQSRQAIGDVFARNAGYNEVGELNNIIFIYPQAIATAFNTLGCWDWWGYTNSLYATKMAEQPSVIWQMIQRVAF